MSGESPSGRPEPLPADLAPGSLVAGYRVESRVGAGALAVVFRAYDEALSRTAALKVLAPALAGDAAFRERFIRKSRAVGAVVHPHILPVFAVGEADGVLYLAMRFVAGGDLRAVLKREGRLTGDRAIALLAPVASALDLAHTDGLLHGNVKPANILVDVRPGHPEHPYLSDFAPVKGAMAPAGPTGTARFPGSPYYAAPEQVSGKPARPQTDQYALACVAYTLLAGAPPFADHDSAAVLRAHLNDAPPSLAARRPGLAAAVDETFARALAKSPEDRYGTCEEMIGALRAALAASPAPPAETVTAPPRHAETLTAPPPPAETVTAPPRHAETLTAPPAPAPSVVAERAYGPVTGHEWAPTAPVPPSPQPQPGAGIDAAAATMLAQQWADMARGSGPATAGDAAGSHPAVGPGPSAEDRRPAQAPPRRRRRGLIVTIAAAAAVVVGAGALIAVHPWVHPPVLKPAGLTVRSDAPDPSGRADTMNLTWSAPATGPLPDDYRVLRNGRQVETVAGTTTRYSSEGLVPNTSYGFQVIAVRGGKQSPVSAMLTVHTPPLQPAGLKVKDATTGSLDLSWRGPAAGPPPDQYEILRNGTVDVTLPGNLTSFEEQGLDPDTAYSFQVVALTGSERSPASAASSARTKKPPLSAAVLNWSGQVTETTTWISPAWPSFKTQPGSSAQDGWVITPDCSSGACDATLTGAADAWSMTAKLTRSGATYTGTAQLASDAFYCATKSQVSSGTVTINITVKSAKTVSGAWTATSFTGYETLYSPAAYSCEANTVQFAVTGELTTQV